MAATNKHKHLTAEERAIIATGIRNGSSKQAIADTLGKDKSTIGKEIKLHRQCTHKFNLPLECAAYQRCTHGRHCTPQCSDFIAFRCPRRDRSPGACNGCAKLQHCRFDKFVYMPDIAHKEYQEVLVDSRMGVNLSVTEAKRLGEIIKPLLAQGQSPYQIIAAHPELGICEKTLYNYIQHNVFSCVSLFNIDLRAKVKRKLPKKDQTVYKKRNDFRYLNGRTYADYLTYMELHPDASVVQMDTVYNDGSNGPFLQTFKFLDTGLLFAIYHHHRTADEMVQGLDWLEAALGRELFEQLVEVLITDRGPEFIAADRMEQRSDGTRRTRIFYCDPMQSGQKGSLENNHKELRYILPKETDLTALGLLGQDDLNLALSHINSAPKEKLNGKSPLELTAFLYPLMMEKLIDLGMTPVASDKVILKPYLLKK